MPSDPSPVVIADAARKVCDSGFKRNEISPIRSVLSTTGQAENAWMKTMVSAWSTASWMEPTACNTRSLQADLNEATAQVILEGTDLSEALQSAEKKFMDAQ